ncbi:MAG: site-specific integrase [Pseudomonadota bacterium]|nr:site-specific integrase [Pseudomonadota bacterium]
MNTVGDLADKFLTDVVEQPGRRKGQVDAERPRLARIRAALGHLPIQMLTPADVAKWRDKRLEEGASPQTVRHDLNTLSVVLGEAVREWGVEGLVNVVRDVRKPPQAVGRSRRLSEPELTYLLRAAVYVPPRGGRLPGRGLAPIIKLAVETSMRLGELLSLEWKRIDFGSRVAFLPTTKNGESRSVALSGAAVAALKQMDNPRRADGRVFDWMQSDSFVGHFIRCVARARALYEADCAASGETPGAEFLADLRFHDLRHEAASRLFEKGLNPMEVASMTGHKSMQMLKRYTHVEAAKVAAKLG